MNKYIPIKYFIDDKFPIYNETEILATNISVAKLILSVTKEQYVDIFKLIEVIDDENLN